MGGWSAEREVSLVTGAAVADALEQSGHDVLRFDIRPDLATLLKTLEPAPGVIFNALHGRFGEDGGIQAILNALKIIYTHSGMVASALAMNKPFANRLFVDAGIRCPPRHLDGPYFRRPGGDRRGEVEPKGIGQVLQSRRFARTLAGHVDFEALRDEPLALAPDAGGKFPFLAHVSPHYAFLAINPRLSLTKMPARRNKPPRSR